MKLPLDWQGLTCRYECSVRMAAVIALVVLVRLAALMAAGSCSSGRMRMGMLLLPGPVGGAEVEGGLLREGGESPVVSR